MKIVLLAALTLLTTMAQADIAEMFPEQLDGSTGSLGEQATLAATDSLLSFLLINRADPKIIDAAKLSAKIKVVNERIVHLRNEMFELAADKQIQTIEASLSTMKEQADLASATGELKHVESLMVESVREKAIADEENRLVIAARLEAYDYGAGKRIEALRQRPTVKTEAERDARLLYAQEKLSRANVELDNALTQKRVTRAELARFPATTQTYDALTTRLAILKSAEGQVRAGEVLGVLKKELQTKQNLQQRLMLKAERLTESSHVLKRAVLWRGLPQVLAALTLSDLGVRAYVYLKGRDPGYAPIGTFVDTMRNLGGL